MLNIDWSDEVYNFFCEQSLFALEVESENGIRRLRLGYKVQLFPELKHINPTEHKNFYF